MRTILEQILTSYGVANAGAVAVAVEATPNTAASLDALLSGSIQDAARRNACVAALLAVRGAAFVPPPVAAPTAPTVIVLPAPVAAPAAVAQPGQQPVVFHNHVRLPRGGVAQPHQPAPVQPPPAPPGTMSGVVSMTPPVIQGTTAEAGRLRAIGFVLAVVLALVLGIFVTLAIVGDDSATLAPTVVTAGPAPSGPVTQACAVLQHLCEARNNVLPGVSPLEVLTACQAGVAADKAAGLCH